MTFTITVKYLNEPVLTFPHRSKTQMNSILMLIETETLEELKVVSDNV